MADHKAMPATSVTILSLLGLFAASKGLPISPPRYETPPALSSGTSTATGHEPAGEGNYTANATDLDTLKPLLDTIYGEVGGVRPVTLEDFIQDLKKQGRENGKAEIRSLIATVPDPHRTAIGFRFDQVVDAIQAAAEANSYVLDRWRIPWVGRHQAVNIRSTFAPRLDGIRPLLSLEQTSETSPASPRVGHPGLLVFRGVPCDPSEKSPLLVVFLVTEMPSSGLDQEAIRSSLRLAEMLEGVRDEPCKGARQLHIVGPSFSGTAPSMERALETWLAEKDINDFETYEIRILSGGATVVNQDRFKKLSKRLTKKLKREIKICFQATIHSGHAVMDTILRFLDKRAEDQVILLHESNTGGGRGIEDIYAHDTYELTDSNIKKKRKQKLVLIPFPLHVGEIRRLYETQGLIQDGAPRALRSVGQLTAPSETTGAVRDVVPNLTPSLTAVTENLDLIQTLTHVVRRRPRSVGIWATDPNDVVFLARQVRRFCPDAQLFTTQAEILYLDPRSMPDLRGMLVGSTYPLYSSNQSWSYPYQGDHDPHLFPSQIAQGTYNATVANLWNMAIPSRAASEPALREYGAPRPLSRRSSDRQDPPVWISIVGERGLYPVHVDWADLDHRTRILDSEKEEEYVYDASKPRLVAASPCLIGATTSPGDIGPAPFNYPGSWCFAVLASSVGCSLLAFLGYKHHRHEYPSVLTDAEKAQIPSQVSSRVGRPLEEVPFWAWVGQGRSPTSNIAMAQGAMLLAHSVIAWPLIPATVLAGVSVKAGLLLLVALLGLILAGSLVADALPRIDPDKLEKKWGWVLAFMMLLLLGGLLAGGLSYSLDGAIDQGCQSEGKGGHVVAFLIYGSISGLSAGLLAKGLISFSVNQSEKERRQRPFLLVTVITAGILAGLLLAGSIYYGAGLILLAGLTGLILAGSLVANTLPRIDPDKLEKKRSQILGFVIDWRRKLVFLISALIASLLMTYWYCLLIKQSKMDEGRDFIESFLAMERVTILTGGVSPVFPAIFLALCFLVWSFASIKRVYISRTYGFEDNSIPQSLHVGETVPWPLVDARETRKRIDERFAAPWKLKLIWAPIIQSLVFGFVLIAPIASDLPWPWSRSIEGGLFDYIYRGLFGLMFVMIAYQTARLHAIWLDVRRLLRDLSSLPLIDAFDRMPSNLATWFFEGPSVYGDRHEKARVMALELKARSVELGLIYGKATFGSYLWEELDANLNELADQRLLVRSTRHLMRMLVRYWRVKRKIDFGLSVPDEANLGREELARRWVEQAEDLVALQFLRWFSAWMAQLWLLIGALTTTSLALLLATTSYPFPLQGRTIAAVAVLIFTVAAVILSVIFGLNSDELVSKLKNQTPGRITPDAALMNNLATYIVPLLGIPFVLSLDVADIFRSLFDPLFRIFM